MIDAVQNVTTVCNERALIHTGYDHGRDKFEVLKNAGMFVQLPIERRDRLSVCTEAHEANRASCPA